MELKAQEKQEKSVTEPSVRVPARARHKRLSTGNAVALAEVWPQVIARIREAKWRLLLLDFDGTLVAIRRRPQEVHLSQQGKKILRWLVRLENFSIAIISGRELRTIKRLVGIKGLQYIGLHGAEQEGKTAAVSEAARCALESARKKAQEELKRLRGIEIENKGLSFAVHYRRASLQNAELAGEAARKIVASATDKLRILPGKMVWEVLPRQFPGKGSAALALFNALAGSKIAIYFGDDETDEEAFAVLPGQVTVNVGTGRNTRAAFYVRNHSEVMGFLRRLEKELR